METETLEKALECLTTEQLQEFVVFLEMLLEQQNREQENAKGD